MTEPRLDAGATAVEYALMVALITLIIFGSVAVLGGKVPGLFAPVIPALQ